MRGTPKNGFHCDKAGESSSKGISNTIDLFLNVGLTFLYTNAGQFVNKRDDLLMFMRIDKPNVMLDTEVIPKSQSNPITQALLDIEGYDCTLNFEPEKENLGASDIRGVAIYSKKNFEGNRS